MSAPLPLWGHLQVILQRCRAHESWLLLSDYDGTLTPLVPHPDDARLSPTMQARLHALAGHPHWRLAIVSGRALADLRARVGGQPIYLAGNHGLEIDAGGERYEHPAVTPLRPQLHALADTLRGDLAAIPGLFIEDKGLTLSVHYRQVPPHYLPTLKARLLASLRPALDSGVVTLRTGKAVFEVRPQVEWHKGTAVSWIVARLRREVGDSRALAIYLGDDDTDEDAFRALASTGLTIVVGADRLHSTAHYYVESVAEVEQFLAVLQTQT